MLKTMFSYALVVTLSVAAISATAQTTAIKKPADGSQINSPFLKGVVVTGNAATASAGNSRVAITAVITMDPNKQTILTWTSNVGIKKIVVSSIGNGKSESAESSYSDGQNKSGYFYLDSPAYGGYSFYTLDFYAVGDDQATWRTTLERKKPQTIKDIKVLPNQ